jgi:hypothetical protein
MDPLEQYVNKHRQPEADPLESYVAKNSAAPQAPKEKEGAGTAALEAYGNTATLGYLPHIQAAVEKSPESLLPLPIQLITRAFKKSGPTGVDADLAAKGFKIEQAPEKSYVQTRDENIARQKQQKKDFPTETTVGAGLGIVGGGLITPTASIAKSATLIGKMIAGAKTGAVMGGLMNPGDVEGDVSVMPKERGLNALAGGVIGGLMPPVIEGGKWLATGGAQAVAKTAAEKAYRALGRNTPQAMQKAVNSGENVAIGRELLDEGAIPILGTPGRISGRVDKLKEQAGERVGALVKSTGSAKLVDAEKLGIDILDSPELNLMRKTPGMEGAVAAIEKQVETLARNGKMNLEEAQALRQAIDKSIKWNKATPDVGAAEGLRMQRTGIRDAMNEGINSLNPGAPKDQLLSANRKYGNMAQASDILEKELARNQSNRSVSLTDTGAAAAGMIKGGPVMALALGALNKAGRAFGNSIQARGYDALAKGLAKSAPVIAAAENNPGVVSRLATALAQTATGGKKDYAMDSDELLQPEMLMLFKKDKGLIDLIEDPRRRALIKDRLKRSPAAE